MEEEILCEYEVKDVEYLEDDHNEILEITYTDGNVEENVVYDNAHDFFIQLPTRSLSSPPPALAPLSQPEIPTTRLNLSDSIPALAPLSYPTERLRNIPVQKTTTVQQRKILNPTIPQQKEPAIVVKRPSKFCNLDCKACMKTLAERKKYFGHTGKKFVCSCGKDFTRNSSLKRHRLLMHSVSIAVSSNQKHKEE